MKIMTRVIVLFLILFLIKGNTFAQTGAEIHARVLEFAEIKSGMIACEVGAGNGNFALRLADKVGSSGKVYANDIVEKGKLDVLRNRATDKRIKNIETILGTETDPKLPPNVMDLVFIVYSFHDFSNKIEMLNTIAQALKAGGKLIISDPEMEKEEPQSKNRNRLISREHFLTIINQSPFQVVKIDDKSFSKDGPERLVIYELSIK